MNFNQLLVSIALMLERYWSHHDRWCYGKTPMQTFIDSLPLAKEKILAT
jgi:hypothetical protein